MVNVVGDSQAYSIKPLRLALLLLCMVCIYTSGNANGQAPEATKPSDVRLVIDISGSMKKNDPQNLRRPALDMLVQLLPEGSKAGIWTFGQYVNMLVPHKPVTPAWGNQASAASSEIKSIAQFTNIGAALEKAAYDHKQQSNKDKAYQTHVILLTDGMVDIDRDNALNRKERQRILDKVLPMYQQAGITLHTIALSDNADKKLLNKLALGTDGKVAIAKDAEQLMSVFLQVFNQAVPLEAIAFDGDRFAVDSSIEEFTALIFRQKNAKSTTVVSPDGQEYTKDTKDSRVNWHHTNQYDLITIKEPLEGEWGVLADVAPQSRVTVVSDLSVAVKSMPTNIPVDEAVQASLVLREENKTITQPEFLGLLNITANVKSPTGNDWSQTLSSSDVPVDGIYSTTFNQFSEEGEYTINFVVEGKTFNRQYTHQLSVRTPFSVNTEKSKNNGLTTFSVEVLAQSPTVDVNKTTVAGVIKSPSGQATTANFTSQQDGTWVLAVSAKESGDYIVNIRVNSVNNENVREKIILDALRLSPNEDNIFNSEPSKPKPSKPKPSKSEQPASKSVQPPKLDPVAEPMVEEVKEDSSVEEPVTTAEEKIDYSQIILYGIIGLINIIIIVVGYIIYRKLFKTTPEDADGDASEDKDDVFTEPPMDEMAVDELLEEEIAEEMAMDEPELVQTPSDDADDAMAAALMDAEDDDDDIPDFSLDDFSPESLDEDELEEELDLDENEDDKK
jgi:uncharacterized protein (TIGR03503 family)